MFNGKKVLAVALGDSIVTLSFHCFVFFYELRGILRSALKLLAGMIPVNTFFQDIFSLFTRRGGVPSHRHFLGRVPIVQEVISRFDIKNCRVAIQFLIRLRNKFRVFSPTPVVVDHQSEIVCFVQVGCRLCCRYVTHGRGRWGLFLFTMHELKHLQQSESQRCSLLEKALRLLQ